MREELEEQSPRITMVMEKLHLSPKSTTQFVMHLIFQFLQCTLLIYHGGCNVSLLNFLLNPNEWGIMKISQPKMTKIPFIIIIIIFF